MKSIWLIGEWFSQNLGDGVICQTVEALFNDRFNIIPIDISLKEKYDSDGCNKFNLKEFSQILSRRLLLKTNIKKNNFNFSGFDREIKIKFLNTHPDAIIFAGGQMFMDYFLQRIYYFIRLADNNDIPIFFIACGIGNTNTEREKKLLKNIINNNCVKYISLRDGFDYLNKFTKKDIINTFDSAVLSCERYERKSPQIQIGLGIMLDFNISFFEQVLFWRNLIFYFLKKNIRFKIFTNGNINDRQFAAFIIKSVGLDEEKYFTKAPTSPEELVSTVTGFSNIISMRLHSLIISYSFDIPCVGIYWDNKQKEFFSKIGRDEYLCNIKDSPNEVIKKLKKARHTGYDTVQKKEIIDKIYFEINKVKDIILAI